MQLQALDWSRIIPIFITQLFIAMVFFYLSYKVLKRHKTRISIICSGIFIPIAAAFIVNIIYLPLRINPTVLILHVFSIFLLFLGQIFILMFNLNLLKSKFEFTMSKQLILFVIYATITLLVLIIPSGITIDQSTEWRPLYSFTQFLVLVLFTTACLSIPSILFSIKIYLSFEDPIVKKKWRYYLLGYLGLVYSFYALLFYNTFADPLLRAIHSIISALVLIPSGILVYLGIGRQLQK